MAPRFGEAREQRPASDLAPGGRDLPRVVVAVGRVRQVRREVDRRQAHELRGQIVSRERRAVVRGAGAAIRTWVANRHGRTVPAEWPGKKIFEQTTPGFHTARQDDPNWAIARRALRPRLRAGQHGDNKRKTNDALHG